MAARAGDSSEPRAVQAANAQPRRLPVGEALVASGLISPETLQWALRRQHETGERLGQILLVSGKVNRLDLQHELGRQWGLPFIDLLSTPIDTDLTQLCDPQRLVDEGWIPVARRAGTIVVATCEPPTQELIASARQQLGAEVPLQWRTTTPLDLERAILTCYREHVIRRSTVKLLSERPDLSAAAGFSRGQKWSAVIVVLLAILVAVTSRPGVGLEIFIAAANLIFLGAIMFKFACVMAGLLTRQHVEAGVERDDRNLPVYTVLVPVYKEANIVGDLIENLAAIDYPAEKLDVLVLLESDDVETISAAREAKPPANFRLIIVPDAMPKTKPKACNVGLFLARGDLLVIYDAEDRPEPLQLRKAVSAFENAGDEVVCVQARLKYWNAETNLLARMFGLEYDYWFGSMLPGLDRLRMPIPLGGTSNHFRIDALRRLGGWDPHNVTEDADLGLRAAVEGDRVAVIDSYTEEEACVQVRPWIRQRTRWIKGYMQTALVHSRSPVRLVRSVGLKDTVGFLLLIAGTPLTFLLGPVLWIGTALWYFFGVPHMPLLESGLFWTIALINLIVGNVVMIVLNAIGAVRERGWRWAPYAILNPFYWVLHSWAAWRALIQLIRNPFYWEKTPHGLDSRVDNAELSLNRAPLRAPTLAAGEAVPAPASADIVALPISAELRSAVLAAAEPVRANRVTALAHRRTSPEDAAWTPAMPDRRDTDSPMRGADKPAKARKAS